MISCLVTQFCNSSNLKLDFLPDCQGNIACFHKFFLLIFLFYCIYFPVILMNKNVLTLVYSNTVEYNEALSLRYMRLLFVECLVPVVPETDY